MSSVPHIFHSCLDLSGPSNISSRLCKTAVYYNGIINNQHKNMIIGNNTKLANCILIMNH